MSWVAGARLALGAAITSSIVTGSPDTCAEPLDTGWITCKKRQKSIDYFACQTAFIKEQEDLVSHQCQGMTGHCFSYVSELRWKQQTRKYWRALNQFLYLNAVCQIRFCGKFNPVAESFGLCGAWHWRRFAAVRFAVCAAVKFRWRYKWRQVTQYQLILKIQETTWWLFEMKTFKLIIMADRKATISSVNDP